MCKCACFDWFKKLFGLKKNCCCSADEKKEANVSSDTPVESVNNAGNSGEVAAPVSQNQVNEIPAEEKGDTFEQK